MIRIGDVVRHIYNLFDPDLKGDRYTVESFGLLSVVHVTRLTEYCPGRPLSLVVHILDLRIDYKAMFIHRYLS